MILRDKYRQAFGTAPPMKNTRKCISNFNFLIDILMYKFKLGKN